MALEEGRTLAEDGEPVLLKDPGGLEQLAPAEAPDHVAAVVTDDRGAGRDEDHDLDREPSLTGEDRSGDQSRLAGDRHAARFDRDQGEEDEQPQVLGDRDCEDVSHSAAL